MTADELAGLWATRHRLAASLAALDAVLANCPPWEGPCDWRRPPGFVGGVAGLRFIHPDGTERTPRHGGRRNGKRRAKQGQARPRWNGKRAG